MLLWTPGDDLSGQASLPPIHDHRSPFEHGSEVHVSLIGELGLRRARLVCDVRGSGARPRLAVLP